jgi:TM2 domain-containing membrane protein YozV
MFILFYFCVMKTILVLVVMVMVSVCPAYAEHTSFAQPAPNNVAIVFVEQSTGDTIVSLVSKDSVPADQNKFAVTADSFKKKLLAGFLSFPFPLGFLGTHRIMLGTKPWVPVVYVATFGGCFGLLPLIDFCVIMLSDNVEQYENNPNVFMWIK